MIDMAPQSLQEVEAIAELRRCFRAVASTIDGRIAIAWILRELGVGVMDEAHIVPEKIAVAHRILGACGVIHPEAQLDEVLRAMVDSGNDIDLVKLRQQLGGNEDGRGD